MSYIASNSGPFAKDVEKEIRARYKINITLSELSYVLNEFEQIKKMTVKQWLTKNRK